MTKENYYLLKDNKGALNSNFSISTMGFSRLIPHIKTWVTIFKDMEIDLTQDCCKYALFKRLK